MEVVILSNPVMHNTAALPPDAKGAAADEQISDIQTMGYRDLMTIAQSHATRELTCEEWKTYLYEGGVRCLTVPCLFYCTLRFNPILAQVNLDLLQDGATLA